jgi:hypothetical protein
MGLLDNFSFEKAKTNLLGTTPEEQSKALSGISSALRSSTKPGESAFGNVSQAILGGRTERDIATKNSSLVVKTAARKRANDFLALMPTGKTLSDLSPADQLKVKTYIESEDGDYSSLFNLDWKVDTNKGDALSAMYGKYTPASIDAFVVSGKNSDLDPVDKPTEKGPDVFKRAGDLRSELAKDFDFKNYKQAQLQYGKIETSAARDSAAGDLSLIFAYMKMLDPTSVVRESEQATAENARGVPDSVRNLYNRVFEGEKLAVDQRKDFVYTAGDLLVNIKGRAQPTISRITGIAERAKIPTIDIFGENNPSRTVLNAMEGLRAGTDSHEAAFNALTDEQKVLAIELANKGKL